VGWAVLSCGAEQGTIGRPRLGAAVRRKSRSVSGGGGDGSGGGGGGGAGVAVRYDLRRKRGSVGGAARR
jgi:hypothetical protein